MAKTHVVKQGEHLSSIAARHGFADFHVIWDHPNNAALKSKREAHVLFPGDQLFIPDRAEKTESVETGRVHDFEVSLPPLFLRLRVRNVDDKPVAGAAFALALDKQPPESGTTDGKGMLTQEIANDAENGELRIPDRKLKFDLKVGHLDPEDRFTGQQARLNNLGYFAGFSTSDEEQLRWAVEEFQCDHMGKKPVSRKPVILKHSDQPDEKSGVVDTGTQDAIKKEHGV